MNRFLGLTSISDFDRWTGLHSQNCPIRVLPVGLSAKTQPTQTDAACKEHIQKGHAEHQNKPLTTLESLTFLIKVNVRWTMPEFQQQVAFVYPEGQNEYARKFIIMRDSPPEVAPQK